MYETERAVMTILMIYLVVLGILFLGWLASYILRGIGMYTIGKRKRMSSPWLAFIPFARVYFQGELSGTIRLKKKEIKTPGIWLLLLPIVGSLASGVIWGVVWSGMMARIIPAIEYYSRYDAQGAFQSMFSGTSMTALLVGLMVYLLFCVALQAAESVLQVLINQQVYSECTTKNLAILHAVLGIFIPLYTSFYYFIIRNRVPEAPAYYGYNPYQGMGPGPQMTDGAPVTPQQEAAKPEEMHQEAAPQEELNQEKEAQEEAQAAAQTEATAAAVEDSQNS